MRAVHSSPSGPDVDDRFTVRIRVDVARQEMTVTQGSKIVRRFPVSTSKFGLGTEPGSFKTPTGRFRIAEKIGHDAPLGMVFRSRQATGEISPPGGEEDRILTRILWLDGCDASNAGTKDRYIYIHGTNQEDLIGTPASHGCIRLRNSDMAELFDLVPENTPVEIG